MGRFDKLREMLRTNRTPPLAPTAFAKLLKERCEAGDLSFSNAADVDLVTRMYQEGFVRLFERYRDFDPDGFFAAFAAMDWGEAEALQIAAALSYAVKHCDTRSSSAGVSLRLEGNKFGKAGSRAVEKAIKGSKVFTGVQF